MKFWKRLGAAVLAAAVAVSFSVSSASACTSLFIGSELTENGSTYFGRGEDIGGKWTKVFQVIEAADHEEGELYEDSTGFTMPWPAHTLRYTIVRDSLELGENITDDDGNVVIPAYAQAGINELGVSVTATVSTIYDNSALDQYDAPEAVFYNYDEDADQWVEVPFDQWEEEYCENTGIAEISIAGVILQQAASAREGVELLADILDEYGAGYDYNYYNSILISDTEETWNFQIVSAHNYVAVKLPADKVSINPNILMVGEVDTADTENVVASPELISMPKENGFLVSSQSGGDITRINIRETYGTDDGKSQYSRYWQGVHYLNEELAAQLEDAVSAYDGEEMLHSSEEDGPISYLFDPDHKLTTYEAMRFFAARGEGTDFDSNVDPKIYPIGNQNQAEVHLFEVRHDEALPAQLATIEWLALNRAEYGLFLPFYAGLLDEVSDVFACDWLYNDGDNFEILDEMEDLSELPENSLFWALAALNDLCDNDREHYGANVKAFWEEYQNALIQQQAAVDKAMLNIYNASPDMARQAANALGKAVSEEAFGYARQILTELWDFIREYEAGELPEDTVFTPSVMGKLPAYSIAMAYGDVDSGAWYAENVAFAAEHNLMLGVNASSFAPNRATSGDHAVVVLARLAGAGLADTGADWYVQARKWAEEKGYSQGLKIDGGAIAREDLIVMLWRFAGAKAVEQDLSAFSDAEQISDYALSAMKWAVSAGLIQGYSDGTLRPAGSTSRAELAKLLNVLCDTVLNQA